MGISTVVLENRPGSEAAALDSIVVTLCKWEWEWVSLVLSSGFALLVIIRIEVLSLVPGVRVVLYRGNVRYIAVIFLIDVATRRWMATSRDSTIAISDACSSVHMALVPSTKHVVEGLGLLVV